MSLDEKISEILKDHPGGEDFFNHLDEELRTSPHWLVKAYQFLQNYMQNHYEMRDWGGKHSSYCTTARYFGDMYMPVGLVLTGSFGMAAMNCLHQLNEYFEDIIIVNGGIRKGAKVNIKATGTLAEEFILFDDSIYSGTTRDKIEEALQELNPDARIVHSIVIYDGSKDHKNISSLYQYYK